MIEGEPQTVNCQNMKIEPPQNRSLMRSAGRIFIVSLLIFGTPFSVPCGKALGLESKDPVVTFASFLRYRPLLSQASSSGESGDIKVMPDGTRKRRCPSCGEYHLDVQDAETVMPPVQTPPPVPPVPDTTVGLPFDSPDTGSSDSMPLPPGEDGDDSSITNRSVEDAARGGISSLVTAGITTLGAGLMMLGSGVKPSEVIDGLREWIDGEGEKVPSFPPDLDEFEQWRHCYESRGWSYSESNGTAQFTPVEGASDERGWTFSEQRGEFVSPGESHRPPPLPSPADVAYREEVRLMQEDLKRHQELLDREKERLNEYQKAGLDPLRGTKERIREYEKLVKLSRSELDRLHESTSVQSGDRQPVLEPDLKAEAAERVKTRADIDKLIDSEIAVENSKARLSGSPIQRSRFRLPPELDDPGEGI